MSKLNLRAGELIEVRSKEEILRTLDKNGRLDELPFMPQMFEYCGRRLRVAKRAHKTCDTVNDFIGRRMKEAVHLEGTRCDGKVYGGCQAGCFRESRYRKGSSPAGRSRTAGAGRRPRPPSKRYRPTRLPAIIRLSSISPGPLCRRRRRPRAATSRNANKPSPTW